ncbi:MAG: D-TA family PLP-dependent enzyme [Shimia sp.]|uniref:D-TA family PLP-dependent enzyme n=1 Tax=Shimia sp. TaxID=1954381 RepID=UPI003B8BD062
MTFPSIDTPAVLIDLNIAEANIDRYQAYCDDHKLHLRPHIKTHKLPLLAKRQLEAGAVGICCQKVSEAEAMISEGGIENILITYNILGSEKLARLRALSEKVRLSVVADSKAAINGLSDAFTGAPTSLTVLVECDTGGARCGVMTPEQAADLAAHIDAKPGLAFGGLMTHPSIGQEATVQNWLTTAVDMITATGLQVQTVSIGSSPNMWRTHDVPIATEYRIGTYIYNDRSLVAHGVCTEDDCALTVLATVVSVPNDTRAIIDAGSKVLTSDLLGLEGHGGVVGRPDITISGLAEEHGILTADTINLTVGDRLRIIPNHACVVTNMMDEIQLIRGDTPQGAQPVAARGKVW